jgi:uncharacterized protein (DUF2267 family)
MVNTGISAFESTLHTTNVWLQEIMDLMEWDDRKRAYHALRIVLHALRDRLSVDEAAALGAQLPMLIRGIYYENWSPHGKPVKERRKRDFLAHVEEAFEESPTADAEDVCRAVFQVLTHHVSVGEIAHVKATLPEEIRELWKEPERSIWF